jgi:hypothetical protein
VIAPVRGRTHPVDDRAIWLFGEDMTRLILTTDDSGAGTLRQAAIADIVIPFGFRFVWGPLPSDAELAASLTRDFAQRDQPADHWLWNVYRKHFGEIGGNEIRLIDFCERCETIELWIDPGPNAQLTLIWLLDHLRHHDSIVSKLILVQSDDAIGNYLPEHVATWRLPAIKILDHHLEQASTAWRAYRAPTPRDWCDLLSRDLGVLPGLRRAVVELLEELPMRATGLGATEMRMLQLLSHGYLNPFALFPHHFHQRKVFGYWEAGSLLEGLAHCPAPAVSGLGEGPFEEEMHNERLRHERYVKSRLSLTTLGEAIFKRTEDFSQHNPISRWWGGTKLTNDNLWRWDPGHRSVIAP